MITFTLSYKQFYVRQFVVLLLILVGIHIFNTIGSIAPNVTGKALLFLILTPFIIINFIYEFIAIALSPKHLAIDLEAAELTIGEKNTPFDDIKSICISRVKRGVYQQSTFEIEVILPPRNIILKAKQAFSSNLSIERIKELTVKYEHSKVYFFD